MQLMSNVRPHRLPMSYSSLDPVIVAWARQYGFVFPTLDDRGAELDFRNAYTSNNAAKCCQIWVDPPKEKRGQVFHYHI